MDFYTRCFLVAIFTSFPVLATGNLLKLGHWTAGELSSRSASSYNTHMTTAAPVWKYRTPLQPVAANVRAQNGTISQLSLTTGGNYNGNSSNGSLDQCWTSWEQHWAWTPSVAICVSTVLTLTGLTHWQVMDTSTFITTNWLYTRTYFSTEYAPGDRFPITTFTETETQKGIETVYYGTDVMLTDGTDISTIWSTCATPADDEDWLRDETLTPPDCTMPYTYSVCQTAWNNFANGRGGEPRCSWATLNPSQCDQVLTREFWDGYHMNFYWDGGFGPPIWMGNSIGPRVGPKTECNLGCADCRITGDAVKLLYWPPETAPVQELWPGSSSEVVAYVDGTTLTSPTMYVSYQTLFAMDSCRSTIGRTFSNTIIPIASNHLSSMVYQQMLYPDGSFTTTVPNIDFHYSDRNLIFTYKTVPFNVTELQEPVPSTIYDKLPWCAKWTWSASLYNQVPRECPTNTPYAPLIAIPPEAKDLEPEWAKCHLWSGGLFDPPSALQGATIVVPVTRPSDGHTTTTPASPSSSIAMLPTQTAARLTWSDPGNTAPGPSQATATFTAGGKTFTAIQPENSAGSVSIIVDKTTIRLGHGTEVIGGQTMAVLSSGNGIAFGTKTISFPTQIQNSGQSEVILTSKGQAYTMLEPQDTPGRSQLSITVDGDIITANSESQFIIGSQTLSPGGPPITIDSSTYSLAAGGTDLFINGQKTTFQEQAELPKTQMDSIALELLSDMMAISQSHVQSEVQSINVAAVTPAGTSTTKSELSSTSTSPQAPVEPPKKQDSGASTIHLQYASLGVAIGLGLLAVL